MRLNRRRPPVRHQEFAAPAAGDSNAIGVGRGEESPLSPKPVDRRAFFRTPFGGRGVGGEGSPRGRKPLIRPASPATFSRGEKGALPPSPSGRGVGGEGARRQSMREPSRVIGPRRAVAAESLEPGRKIDRVAAEPAFGQHDRDLGGRPRVAPARGVDDHAREARRQRETGDRAALVGDAAVAVERADRGQAAPAPRRARRAAAGRGSAASPDRRRPTARSRARSRRGRPTGSRARRKAEARRSPPPPTGDSRRRARPARRGRAAGRRWPCRRAPSRAGSARRPARRRGTRMSPQSTTTRTPFDRERRLGDRGREHDLAPPGVGAAMARSCARASSAP